MVEEPLEVSDIQPNEASEGGGVALALLQVRFKEIIEYRINCRFEIPEFARESEEVVAEDRVLAERGLADKINPGVRVLADIFELCKVAKDAAEGVVDGFVERPTKEAVRIVDEEAFRLLNNSQRPSTVIDGLGDLDCFPLLSPSMNSMTSICCMAARYGSSPAWAS